MQDEQEDSMNFSSSYNNNMGYTGESIIKIRLDTQQLLSQIECFLKGQAVVIDTDTKTGMLNEKIVKTGEPLANERGVHAILSLASATINSQTVQGNYDWEIWREEVAWCREQLATDLFVNHDDWGVHPQNISLICNTIMNMIKPFLTRLVNNEERKSYSNYQEMRTIQAPQNSGAFSKLGKIFG